MKSIFDPINLGGYKLSNAFAMAPMTRSRANMDGTLGELTSEYYSQRASLGLIITEGVQPSDDGQGYIFTPGIYTKAHINGWQPIINSVHTKGGHLFMQLMHAGRVSHPTNTPHHRTALAPSAIAPNSKIFTLNGMLDIPTPKAMTTQDINQTIDDFRHAARCAIEAGADGVEIHGANGYLIQQFLAPNANTRIDQYGGSIENRTRFAIEVASAIVQEIGSERTAIRLSPGLELLGIDEGAEAPALYHYLVEELNKLNLVYLHIMHMGNEVLLKNIRNIWKGKLIINRPGKDRKDIGMDIQSGLADLEAYGQMILANPDFIKRIRENKPLNIADRNTFFGGNAVGYTDYPYL